MFPRLTNRFLPFPIVFLHVFSSVFTVSSGVSPVSPQFFPCFLFYIMRFLNTSILRTLQFFKSSISSNSQLISLSWPATFPSCSANLIFKLRFSSLFCWDILIASLALFSTNLIAFPKSVLTASILFYVVVNFTFKISNLLLISSLISSRLADELPFAFLPEIVWLNCTILKFSLIFN